MRCDWSQKRHRRWLGGVAVLAIVSAASGASAQDSSPVPMVNLVRQLVKQGTITPENGDILIAQAEADSQQTRMSFADAAAAAGLSAPPVATAVNVPPPSVDTSMPAAPAGPQGAMRVQYIPEPVRRQIRDEVRAEVMAQAKAEGWAAPGDASPDWVRRIKLSGDLRVRSESDLFAKGNADDIINFSRINNSGPFNFNAVPLVLPFINTTEDRTNQLKLRARLAVEAQLGSHVAAGVRIASGDDNGPISTNVSLGGGFAKRDVWLDRAYLTLIPTDYVSATFGRMANPFRSTDLLFDVDLNFDGVAVTLDAKPFLENDASFVRLHAGAFPLDFGSSNFPDTIREKNDFPQKWLYSAQLEGGTTVGNIELSGSAAYHVFHNIQGQLSTPCNTYKGLVECSSDPSRPFFLRTGNTIFPIRQIAVDPNLPANTLQPNPQFVGLTFGYRVLDINASASMPINDRLKVTVDGNYLRNLAYKSSDVCRYAPFGLPFNNVLGVTLPDMTVNENPCTAQNPARFTGGNQGYSGRVTVGYPKPAKFGEWNVSAGYRYLESDAVLDSLTDSDFHLGGTNSKGYTIGGTFGLFDGVSVAARWLSANEISGRPLAIDVLQFDLMAAF